MAGVIAGFSLAQRERAEGEGVADRRGASRWDGGAGSGRGDAGAAGSVRPVDGSKWSRCGLEGRELSRYAYPEQHEEVVVNGSVLRVRVRRGESRQSPHCALSCRGGKSYARQVARCIYSVLAW